MLKRSVKSEDFNRITRRFKAMLFAVIIASVSIIGSSMAFAAGTYSNLSYTERPTKSEFSWWYNGVFQNGAPSGVRWLDSSEYQGSWKGYVLFPPQFGDTTTVEELVNINIAFTSQQVVLTWDPYYSRIGGQDYDDQYMDDSFFTGYEWGAGIYVTGGGNITIDEFYELNDVQYATGTMVVPSGETGYVALMRP